jgi:hypothetical protein
MKKISTFLLAMLFVVAFGHFASVGVSNVAKADPIVVAQDEGDGDNNQEGVDEADGDNNQEGVDEGDGENNDVDDGDV